MAPSRSIKIAAFAALVVVLSSCTIVNRNTNPTPKTQTQVREMQTREFDTNDVNLVLKAVLNTLQDDGFVVKNAVPELGLLTAVKELQLSGSSGSSSEFWSEMFENLFRSGGSKGSSKSTEESRYNKFRVVEVSVNVTEYGSRTKVRANFQAKVLDNRGDPVEVYTIDDQRFYQEFFLKVDKGIFLQKQGL